MGQELNDLITLARKYDNRLPDLVLPDGHPGSRSFAAWVDHTLLKPEATPEQIEKLCAEARQYQFASVCINPLFVPLAADLLAGSPVLVCTVIGFPLGATLSQVKAEETRQAIGAGAREVDMVIPVGMLKGERYETVANDIQSVVEAAHPAGAVVKVILEMALLSRFEKIIGCLISQTAGADFVKTSTGFGPGGATLEDVELMRRVVGPRMGVKAAGGVRSLADARAMLLAGATRLGTSAGVKIMQEAAQEIEAR
ncbi:MAG: deoxyribose-phosphate aldolase [Anaerolineaceae bacterium]|nr:deoxyribose-phosphate aldolase [Anaerolineaceae bacterium]